MSSIETAYGQRIADRLCAAIEALGAATAAYRTTGDAQTQAAIELRIMQSEYDEMEANKRAAYLTDADLGTNDRQRAANLTVRLLCDTSLIGERGCINSLHIAYDEAERAHKNAYHDMESNRVAIGGYAAVLGATKD